VFTFFFKLFIIVNCFLVCSADGVLKQQQVVELLAELAANVSHQVKTLKHHLLL